MRAMTFSSYINAYTIYKGVESVGISFATADEKPVLPIPIHPSVSQEDWLFYTEEASLRRALIGELVGHYLPRNFPLPLLDDKWALAEWLAANPSLCQGLKQWKLCDTLVVFPCLVKSKHSWQNQEKLPRGWICRNGSDLQSALALITREGYAPEAFFIQEWLGDGPCRVISVCGFHDTHDQTRNLVAVVERIAAHTEGLSCSSAVETIPDEWGLIDQTKAILDALSFVGPYEMEFLVVGDRVLVLELNPRFWMQHAIFLVAGNGLIKRYLNLETENDLQQRIIQNIVWIDGIHLVKCVMHFKVNDVRLVLNKCLIEGKQVVIWPSLRVSSFYWISQVWRKRGALGLKLLRLVNLSKSITTL